VKATAGASGRGVAVGHGNAIKENHGLPTIMDTDAKLKDLAAEHAVDHTTKVA